MEKIKIMLILAISVIIISSVSIFTLYNISGFFTSTESTPKTENIPQELPKVTITKLTYPSCKDCFDVDSLVDSLEGANIVNIVDVNEVSYDAKEAKDMINKYNITKIPTILIFGEIRNDQLASIWENVGVTKEDALVFTSVPPLYFDITTDQIKGRVSLINLVDDSCSACYNISTQENILTRNFGVILDNKMTYDISSVDGKNLLNKYNITRIPTIILSPGADAYQNLNQVWGQVGSIENDGWYVFRNLDALGGIVYEILPDKQLVNTTS